MVAVYIIIALIVVIGLVVFKKRLQLNDEKKKANDEIARAKLAKLSPIGSVKELSILPLIDFYASQPGLKTEPGVSSLVQADDATILVDVGWNTKKTHPSPLLDNMNQLGVSRYPIWT